MRDHVPAIAFTKSSSRGQIVIPAKMRKRFGIREGSVFTIAARNDMIVLKKIDSGLSVQDLKSLKAIEEAWKDIEHGRYRVMPKKSFLKELEEW